MLEHLEIRNFALIENLSIDFAEGFNVITGETGAGKSIILGALGLLMGEKADVGAIRTGAEELTVNAVISVPSGHEINLWLKERGVEPEDGAVILKRTLKRNGRSVISLQGELLSRAELTEFADSLIDMHGQSEHQSLLLPDRQRGILDAYAGNSELLDNCAVAYKAVVSLEKSREDLVKQAEEGRRQEDYLSFALNEIKSAGIREGEDSELKERISVLSMYETIYENIEGCTERLREARSLMYDASAFCSKAAKCDSSLADYSGRLESARLETEDIVSGLKEYLGSVDYSEDAVNSMQDRLSMLEKLKRKYGGTLEKVLEFAHEAEEKLAVSQNLEENLAACRKELEKARASYADAADMLNRSRIRAGRELDGKIGAVLKTLGMANAVFEVRVTEGRMSAHGSDAVTFMISANEGEPLKPLRETASGGELSRVMLALKTVLAEEDSIETQIFDEIDSGIGGSVAVSLADCMSRLSERKQVIAITHLAVIAGRADCQFAVSKSVEGGRTYTHLKAVQGNERVLEIARMLSGDADEATVEHAKKLLAGKHET